MNCFTVIGNWGSGSGKETIHITSHVVRKEAKRKTKIDSKRKQTFQYFFTVNEEKIKVCKAVFLKTLGIGEKTVAYTLQQQEGLGHAAKDQRGRHTPSNKISD